MKKSRIMALLCASALVMGLVGCGGSSSSSSAGSSAAASGSAAASASGEGETGEALIKQNDFVIGLSNSYYGNTWRKVMVDDFITVAEEAKEKGYISDYEVQNGDNTINNQIEQINTYILKGVDAIVIDPASATALNDVLKKAQDAGIVICGFDCNVEDEAIPQFIYNYDEFEQRVTDIAEISGAGTTEPLNVIEVRGLEGAPADAGMAAGVAKGLESHPNFNVVATVWGQFSATKTQEEISKILPSLPEIDAVITQCGGDSWGAVQAFAQSDRPMPIILGDGGTEYINWWKEQIAANPEFKSTSLSTSPSGAQQAFWACLYMLNGVDVPKNIYTSLVRIEQDELDSIPELEPGACYSPYYSADEVYDEIVANR